APAVRVVDGDAVGGIHGVGQARRPPDVLQAAVAVAVHQHRGQGAVDVVDVVEVVAVRVARHVHVRTLAVAIERVVGGDDAARTGQAVGGVVGVGEGAARDEVAVGVHGATAAPGARDAVRLVVGR